MKYYSKVAFSIIIAGYLIIASCNRIESPFLEEGVSLELAKLRDKQLDQIKYTISFQIPDSASKQVSGSEIIEFYFRKKLKKPLILDFKNPESYIKSLKANEKRIKFHFKNQHIVIPYKKLKEGKNKVEIEFTAGNRALNRNEEYLYTLFVPDRASTAFPCFDQPSLKGRFKTKIQIPHGWISVANAPLLEVKELKDKQQIYDFDETKPISTYLYSFVAGKFKSITKKYDDREMTMYHREDDIEKIKNNSEKIFDLHYSSLLWLENYTQIDYPFTKFDFVIVPSFQYSGMEHPGAILYRDSRLLLETNSTIRERLNRANLIAHETAHMWFGDLVTMEWFSEVWLKEVFANFMAGKMVNPQYPEINHDLNFLINHYPSSYSVDRTEGANPIEQELENMNNAGTLYGSIIYHKAPIVMQKLEEITGKKKLQEGIRKYLMDHQYGNARWDDLILILDGKTPKDLKKWNHSWVYEPGMPYYKVQPAFNENRNLESIIIEQQDPWNEGRMWQQEIEVYSGSETYSMELKDTFNVISLNKVDPDYIFPNSTGLGYGYFQLDTLSIPVILNELHTINNPVLKCSMYMSLWENMLNQNLEPESLFTAYLQTLQYERDPQNINLLLDYIKTIYWKFTTDEKRNEIAQELEPFLWTKANETKSSGLKSAYFNTFRDIALTNNGLRHLFKLWNGENNIPGLKLNEKDFTSIAFELSIRNQHNTDSILDEQFGRISNPEKKERFQFIRKAVSSQQDVRNAFFESLKDEKNREKEPWVIDALHYLHHPLRANKSIKYIRPSLDLLEEIQVTGDIFFPKRWLDATFWGHHSIDAVLAINLFLNENPRYPENLKNKIHQSTDLVFRANIMNEK